MPINSPPPRRSRKRLRANADKGYSVLEASAQCGARVTLLTAARRKGIIPTVFHLAGGRAVPLLDAAAVDDMDAGNRILHHHAAAKLGVTFRAIEELAAAGLLRTAPYIPGRSGEPAIMRDSLEALLARFSSTSIDTRGEWVPLRAAMRRFGGRLKPWAPALRSALIGELPYHLTDGMGSIVDRLSIPKASANSIQFLAEIGPKAGCRYADMMSKQDAADALNLHLSQIWPVLSTWPSNTGPTRTVPVSAVLELARRHIAPTEAAQKLAVSPNAVRSILRENGIEKLSEAGYDRLKFEEVFG